MSWILAHLSQLAWVLGLIVLAFALIAPFEALRWWAQEETLSLPAFPPRRETPVPEDECYVVYLTGIGGSGDGLARREQGFMDRVKERIPEAVMVTDVFPFSVTNDPLTGQRPLAWLWSFLHNARLQAKSIFFEFWIGARNVCPVAVCSDPRYGPIFNLGIAREVYLSLLRHGYDPRSRANIFLVGYSGGAQVALGAACYLTRLRSRVTVITVGGVFSSIPGIRLAHHLHCLTGSKDRTIHLGPLLFPGRWRIATGSAWNRARRSGKVSIVELGPMIHSGRGDYFTQSMTLDNGKTYADHTADVVAGIIRDTERPDRGPVYQEIESIEEFDLKIW
jgi:hypothetical protein